MISIPATIASVAAEAFKKKYRKRITEGTAGGVIQLLQFEIVVTHLGEPSEKLTLLIQEFKHLGSDGSGPFGDPKPIIERKSLLTLLAELATFRNREAARQRLNHTGFDERSSLPDAHSDESIDGPEDENEDIQQRDFATQKARRKVKLEPPGGLSQMNGLQEKRGLKRLRPDGDGEKGSPIHRKLPELSHATGPVAKRQLGDDEAPTARSVVTTRPPSYGSETGALSGHAQLLALLSNKRGGRAAGRTKSNSVTEPQESVNPVEHAVSIPAKSDMIAIDDIINKAAIAAESTLRSTSESPKDIGKDGATLIDLRNSQPGTLEVGSTLTFQKIGAASSHIDPIQVVNDPTAKKKQATVEEVEDPWQGMTCIRKKDKLIPTLQEKLLNRKDCWLPPKQGERTPVSNMPVQILQSLTESTEGSVPSADAQSHSPDKSEKVLGEDRSNEISQESTSSHVSDEEDPEETAFPTSQWPLTPPKIRNINELPPDSSVEVLSPVLMDKLRAVQRDEKTASSEDLGSQKIKSRTSSPVLGVSDVDQSPRSSIGSLIAHDARSDFTLRNQSSLEATSVHTGENNASRGLCNTHPMTTEKGHMNLASSPPISNETRTAVVNIDSDATDSSQSDLEMAVPNALQNHDSFQHGNERQQTPCRAANNRDSTLQVHRTPYTVQHQRVNGNPYPMDMGAFPLNQHLGKWHAEGGQPNDLDTKASTQVLVPGTLSQSDQADQVSVEMSKYPIPQAQAPQTTGINVDPFPQDSPGTTKSKPFTADASSMARTKRLAKQNDCISSNVTKRQKRIKFASSATDDDGDDEKPREDPSTRARQLRREFMKNLKANSNAPAALPSPLLSDVDLREPDDAGAKTDMQSEVADHKQHVPNQAWSTVRASTGPQTPDEPSSPPKPSSNKRKNVLIPQAHDQAVSPQAPSPTKLTQQTILERFREAYPQYEGTEKQFVALCRKVDALEKGNRMLHKSLWDDFVIRHQKEYREYLTRCADEAEDPMPYETFYSAEIDEPKFTKRILSPANLAEAISSGLPAQGKSPRQVRLVVKETVDLTQNSPEPQASEVHQRQSSGKSAVVALQKLSSAQSNEEATPLSEHIQSASTRKSSRKLPWSTANPSSPTPASSKPQNAKSGKMTIASSPASASKDPFEVPRSITQPAPSNVFGAGHSPVAPPRLLPVPQSSTSSRKGKIAVATRDNKPAIPPATAGPAVYSSKGAPSSKFTPEITRSCASPPPEPSTTRAPLPSTKPSKPWYLDPVNPFKAFARANASIRSGADNGFVDEKERLEKRGRPVIVNEDGVVMAKLKRVDVLEWRL